MHLNIFSGNKSADPRGTEKNATRVDPTDGIQNPSVEVQRQSTAQDVAIFLDALRRAIPIQSGTAIVIVQGFDARRNVRRKLIFETTAEHAPEPHFIHGRREGG